MGMSNAERQKKFRLARDSDPVRRQAYLEKCKKKYAEDKVLGKKKLVKDMTEREHRHAKKEWRGRQRRVRHRIKDFKNIEKNLVTPPASPSSDSNPSSRQKKQAKKRKEKDRSKCYRTNMTLQSEIKVLQKKVEMYKKRWEREKQRAHGKTLDSPRTVTNKLLRNFASSKKSTKTVKRVLFQFHVLVKQLRDRYREEKKAEKLRFTRNISGSVLKKYKMKTEMFRILGINLSSKHSTDRNCLSKRICEKIRKFYLREDNSRVVPGIKMTVTKSRKKKQKHILCDSLKNLHEKFLSEGKTKLSYSLFCKLRPFWVLFPTDANRNTCLCKVCENIELKASALASAGVLNCGKVDSIVKELVCDQSNYKCMYRVCEHCSDRALTINETVLDHEIKWSEWKTKREKRALIGKTKQDKVITFTVKEDMKGNAKELLESLDRDLKSFMKHIYNCHNQYRYFKQRRENLKENECIIHIDFSENYVCKHPKEIQSMHFGASKKQLTLHTGIIYHGEKKNVTFCTVSESLNHGPGGIWGHLKTVLTDFKRNNPVVDTIEFFSDGPTTQYKQKGNFFMLATEPRKLGFVSVKWSFFEAGHGKGIPDAIGGTLKREADRKVKYGKDIASASDFVDLMKQLKPKVMLVTDRDIEAEQQKLDLFKKRIKTIPGTMKIHQVEVQSASSVLYRNLSCFCKNKCQNCNEKSQHAKIIENPEDEFDRPDPGETDAQRNDPIESNVNNSKSKVDPSNETNKFQNYLQKLNKCCSFESLHTECRRIASEIPHLTSDPKSVSINENQLEVDIDAAVYIPEDNQEASSLFPGVVHSNGNCLPSCGSVFAYGHPNNTAEIRLRIILELVLNEEKYLTDKYLALGLENEQTKNIANKYAQYSDSFLPGLKLNEEIIKCIFRMEVMSITKDKTYMGIWQIHALANILQVPIFSLYPKLGNPNIRNDLNRLVLPHNDNKQGNPVFILWTTQRDDMTMEHWVPNHFVPLLPFSTSENTDMNNNEIKETNEETIYIYITDRNDELEEENSISKQDVSENNKCMLDTGDYVGRYVLVNYNGRLYPGHVKKISDDNLYVECLKYVGKKNENSFYWPKISDEAWYDSTSVVCTINEPALIKGTRKTHYKVDEYAWNKIIAHK